MPARKFFLSYRKSFVPLMRQHLDPAPGLQCGTQGQSSHPQTACQPQTRPPRSPRQTHGSQCVAIPWAGSGRRPPQRLWTRGGLGRVKGTIKGDALDFVSELTAGVSSWIHPLTVRLNKACVCTQAGELLHVHPWDAVLCVLPALAKRVLAVIFEDSLESWVVLHSLKRGDWIVRQ